MSDTQDTTETDPEMAAFDALVEAAWKEIEAYNELQEAGDVESPTPATHPAQRHAAAFLDMYLAHRPSDIARYAAQYAFMMFTHVKGGSKLADVALAQIGDDEATLADVAQWVIYAYQNDDRHSEAEAFQESLPAKLVSDEARSAVLIDFANNWLNRGEYDKARLAYERIVAMNADEHIVKRAKGMLHEMDNLNVGQMAPAFEATDIDGNAISLAGLRGKAVLIDFWATWCGPCIGEFPHLRRVRAAFACDRLTMLSISLDEDCDAARKMIEKQKLAWTHVCEGQWNGSRIAELYNVMGIPSIFLIGPDGKIAAKDLREYGLDKAISEVLGIAETPAM